MDSTKNTEHVRNENRNVARNFKIYLQLHRYLKSRFSAQAILKINNKKWIIKDYGILKIRTIRVFQVE